MGKEKKTEGDIPESAKAKSDALRLLSFMPRSSDELRKRLRQKKYPAPVVEEAVEALTRQGLLDDAKYAKFFAQSHVYARPTGKRQLAFDMKKKGLSAALVEKTLADLPDYDEAKMARDLVYARFHKMTGVSDEKKKQRLFGFLKRRGFPSGVVLDVIRDLFKEDAGLPEDTE